VMSIAVEGLGPSLANFAAEGVLLSGLVDANFVAPQFAISNAVEGVGPGLSNFVAGGSWCRAWSMQISRPDLVMSSTVGVSGPQPSWQASVPAWRCNWGQRSRELPVVFCARRASHVGGVAQPVWQASVQAWRHLLAAAISAGCLSRAGCLLVLLAFYIYRTRCPSKGPRGPFKCVPTSDPSGAII